MNFNNLIDLHTHTNFSPDAESSPEEMCERAMELGFKAYAITDHCDCNFWHTPEHYTDDVSGLNDLMMYGAGKYAQESIAAQIKLKEKYAGRLNLLCGIELGQPLQNIEKAEKIISNPALDFIIGSHHQNRGMDDFYYLQYDKMDTCEIYRLIDSYFCEMLDMCRWGKFDVLGHLTYPLRYMCSVSIDLGIYEEIIREIFCTLIKSGKGIEINSSGLRQKYGKTFPDIKYVKLFKELGGEIITLGSDAHTAADIGKGIAASAEIAKAAGFRYIAYFKNRKPEFIANQ